MRKMLHFDSPREPYRCDGALVSCYDARITPALRKLLKRCGVARPDIVRLAGGAMSLASPEHESHRGFVLEQIRKSIGLHGTERVLLAAHADCGAYGGLAAFRGDTQAEARHHQNELARAAEYVRGAFPQIRVECYFVDFEGVWTLNDET